MKEITLRQARETKGLSLRKAAELLGVTHPYLSALELGHKKLNPEKAQKIAELYGLDDPGCLVQPLPEDKNSFQHWLGNQIKWWDSRFVLPMIPAVSNAISDLYVAPSFRTELGTNKNADELLKDFFQSEDNRGLLLTGRMGSGKSFFLRVLAVELAKIMTRLKLNRQYVPILVSLGGFEVISGSLVQSLVRYYEDLGFEGSSVQLEAFLRQCIERGSALLLFDGLDEIKDQASRATTLARLQQQFEDVIRKPGNKLIISGQDEAFLERDRRYSGFEMVHIGRWHPFQMYEGCRRWPWDDKSQATQFWLLLQGNDRLFRLARWPLFFHLLTTLHSAFGLRPFQELSGLCDACCQVLENSWGSARQALQSKNTAVEMTSSLDKFGWLKWRHFLIYLLEKVLQQAISNGSQLKLNFTAGEVQQAWEDFLQTRGIDRNSLDYARLEDVIANQSSIGPMHYRRAIEQIGPEKVSVEEYAFIDRSFGIYYLAQALANNPNIVEPFILKYLRDPDWVDVIPLAIQELGRSDRTYENRLATALIELLLSCDDELNLDHQHGIGKFGLFAAMRALGSFNLDRFWDKVVQPFLEQQMNNSEEELSAENYRIIGEYNAAPKIQTYFLNKFSEYFENSSSEPLPQDKKWRVLGCLAKIGTKAEFVVAQFELEIAKFMKDLTVLDARQRVDMRRLFWRLRQVGRLFMLDEDSNLPSGPKTTNVDKLRSASVSVAVQLTDSFAQELSAHRFMGHHYWHVMAVLIQAQSELRYRKNLQDTVNYALTAVAENFAAAFSTYPYKLQLLQFVKAASRYSYMLDRKLNQNLCDKFCELSNNLAGVHKLEVEVILKLLEHGRKVASGGPHVDWYYEEVYGQYSESRLQTWVDIIRQQRTEPHLDYLELGAAACWIGHYSRRLPDDDTDYSLKSVVNYLLNALKIENEINDFQLREEERFYTQPFTDYSYPLYDHLYNCLVSLARALPVLNK
jgi:transcriptional regulator with XRE-family HTH domain